MNLWIDTSPENGKVVRSVNWNLDSNICCYFNRLSADCRHVLYVCCYLLCTSSASGRIIGAKDHASIQINIAEVSAEVVWTPDPSGRARKGLGRSLALKCLENLNVANGVDEGKNATSTNQCLS